MSRPVPVVNNDYTWMTEIPSRNPVVKLHKGVGQAKQAVAVRRGWARGLVNNRENYRSEVRDGRPTAVCDVEIVRYENTFYEAHVFQLVDGEWKYREDLSFVPWQTHVYVCKNPDMVEGLKVEGALWNQCSTHGTWVPK